jgi:oxygen-independent coproporphyrinogen-3 oxidase
MDPATFKSKPIPTAGLYVHVPFCLSKCPYCHFYSTTAVALIPAWAEAVGREAGLYAGRFKDFNTLYFGGGTPSLLPAPVLGRLLEALNRLFSIDPSGEITLEANPSDLSRGKIDRLRSLGFNRISLGAQSFSDRELAFLKRRHTAAETEQAVEWIRAAGFGQLSLDLLYGLPDQSPDQWLETLDRAAALRPDHLSCYQLTVEPGTPLKRRLGRGGLRLPDDRLSQAFFLRTSEFLSRRGYDHYEISNFSLGEGAAARHNFNYWRQSPYLGLGPAAHSFNGRRRWWNLRSLSGYLERDRLGKLPIAGEECLTEEQTRLEALLLGFRTREGVPRESLQLNAGRVRALRSLERSGKIRLRRDRVIPTVRGFLLADRLPLFFC